MRKNLLILLVAAGVVASLAGSASAQVLPTPYFAYFYDSLYLSTFNGAAVPPGSIIQAYDPQNVLCGQDTVEVAGTYGFMPVYGDDATTTPSVDEGAVAGDSIRFKINGRWATVTGNNVWADKAERSVSLAVSGANVAFSALYLPEDQAGMPNDTIKFFGQIQNNGDGLDFYGVNVTDSKGWEIIIPNERNYVNTGFHVNVWFYVVIPNWPGADTVDHISYSFYSHLDTTQHIDGTVNLFASITDVPGGVSLPNGFALSQNYPNPFNPTTSIAFTLPRQSAVQFEVYDITGRLVESRDLGTLNSGDHQVPFDASALASGIYLYRVVTEEGSLVRKMTLTK